MNLMTTSPNFARRSCPDARRLIRPGTLARKTIGRCCHGTLPVESPRRLETRAGRKKFWPSTLPACQRSSPRAGLGGWCWDCPGQYGRIRRRALSVHAGLLARNFGPLGE